MTVLIIGGAFQGKRKIAEKLYPELPKVFNLHEIVRKCIADGRDSMTLLDELLDEEELLSSFSDCEIAFFSGRSEAM